MDIKYSNGWTLLEILLVIGLLLILSALIIPSYQSFIHQSNRHLAEVEMFNLSSLLQEHYTKYNSYRGTKLQRSLHSYLFQFSQINDQSFTIRALPQGKQAKDRCGTLTLNNLGTHLAQQQNCW